MKPQRTVNEKLLEFTKKRPCIVCSLSPCDPCHIRSVGSGGGDDPENIVPMCRQHHTEQHKIGWIRFLEKYPKAWMVLKVMGWTIINTQFNKKLFHPDLVDYH